MGKLMISKGKTIEKIVKKGLDFMKLAKSHADMKIDHLEIKGSPRDFKAALGRIIDQTDGNELDMRIYPLETEELPLTIEISESSGLRVPKDRKNEVEKKYGQVWVKDGQVFCKETAVHYPTITPPKGVSLLKNGELVTKTTVLTEKDEIKIEPPYEYKMPNWSIDFDSEKMTAHLHWEPGYRTTFRLTDQEPSSHLLLEVDMQKELFLPIQQKQIEQQMKFLGINTGIQKSEIQKAMEAPDPGVFIIAKGINPKRGKDGWLERIVNTELRGKNGYADDHGIITIPSVEKGQLIGIIHPPIPGQTGFSVTGKEVQPEPLKEMVVYAGRGINLVEQGTKIVAVESGRPVFNGNGLKAKVSIIPRIIHSSDVDYDSENLRYFGDIVIKGNVNDGTVVEAMADIMIYGNVNQSTIMAGSRIIVSHNIINSNVSSGKINETIMGINSLLKKLSTNIHHVAMAVEQVYQSPIFKTTDIAKMGLSSLIRILLEKKFKDITPIIKEFTELIVKADQQQIIDTEYREICSELTKGFLKLVPTQFKTPEDIVSLADRLKDMSNFSSVNQPDAHIMIPSTFNSELYCKGDISIFGKGSIDSKIYSEGKVQIKGVLRGGEIYAALGVEVNETGTKVGKRTIIRVPEGQSVKINHALEGTVIEIGTQVYHFNTYKKNVFARLNIEGHLLLF